MGFFSPLGRVVDAVGSTFNLPELGVSERLGITSQGNVIGNQSTPYTQMSAAPVRNNFAPVAGPAPRPVSQPAAYAAPDDYYAPAGGGTGGGGGGYTAQDDAYYSSAVDQLNRLLQSSNTQRDQGLSNIGTSYNNSLSRTNEDQSNVLSKYATQRQDTAQGKLGAIGKVDAGARNTYQSLQRLLGLGGAGVSSAAQIAAPWAVSRQASQQRSGVFDTYGRNLRDLDTAETDAKSQFSRVLQDLLGQKQNKEEDFTRGILQQQQGIYGQLADVNAQRAAAQGGNVAAARAPYEAQINERMSQLDNLFNQFRQPAYNVAPVNVRTPELANYTVDPTRIGQQQQNPDVDQSLLPYLAQLKKQNQFSLAG